MALGSQEVAQLEGLAGVGMALFEEAAARGVTMLTVIVFGD